MGETPDDKLLRYQSALKLFLERLEQDRNILAAILVGSLSRETIWRKERIHLWLIEVDGVTKRLKSDGEEQDIFRTLCEEGINLIVQLIPRSRFRHMVEGTSRTSFSCNFFAKRELVYSADPSISKWFQAANKAAKKDRDKELLATTTWAIHATKHANKQINAKHDLELARQTLLWGAHSVAAMEIVRAGQVYEEEAIYRAMDLEPQLFEIIYTALLTKRSKKALVAAMDAMQGHLENRWQETLKPLVNCLRKHGGMMPLSELAERFAFSQLYPWHLESACEWLEEQGQIEKLSSPFKLTKKSRGEVEEPAYMFIG